jgi:hypothetical protein
MAPVWCLKRTCLAPRILERWLMDRGSAAGRTTASAAARQGAAQRGTEQGSKAGREGGGARVAEVHQGSERASTGSFSILFPAPTPNPAPQVSIVEPAKAAPDVFIAPGAVVLGHVSIGRGSSVWYGATLRGEGGRTGWGWGARGLPAKEATRELPRLIMALPPCAMSPVDGAAACAELRLPIRRPRPPQDVFAHPRCNQHHASSQTCNQ